MQWRLLGRSIWVVGIVASSAGAQTLLYNRPGLQTGSNSYDMSGAIEAMNFTLGQTATINQIGFQSNYWGDPAFCTDTDPSCGYRGAIDWAIYRDEGGQLPGALLASGTSSLTAPPACAFYCFHTLTIDPFTAQAGTQYWVSLLNTDNTHSLVSNGFTWVGGADTLGTAPLAYRLSPTDPWTVAPPGDTPDFFYGNRLSLSLYGTTTVPEPSSMVLLGTGLVGIVPVMRRRRK